MLPAMSAPCIRDFEPGTCLPPVAGGVSGYPIANGAIVGCCVQLAMELVL